MPTYKLQYFNFRGKGEFIRYIFHVKGVAFDDEHITTEEWRGAESPKSKTPLGQLPVLHVDGKTLSQTAAIGAYLGETFDLAGADAYDAARCVMLSGGIEDQTPFIKPIAMAVFVEKDAAKIKKLSEEYADGELKKWAERYEGFLVGNGGDWFVGKALTWVDLQIVEFVSKMNPGSPSAFVNTPKLLAHTKKLCELKGLKEFAATRTEHRF